MTRFIHDQFAKDYLKELLLSLGEVETSHNLAGEVREIDVWFVPTLEPTGDFPAGTVRDRQSLGLLGKLATTAAIFEPFRNPVTPSQVRSCMGKLFDIHADLERQAKRENTKVNPDNLPQLWILTPTASVALLDDFRAIANENNWLPGVYFLGNQLKTAIVAIHQLPRTPETLWLRILGKGTVQKQAIAELKLLPESNLFRANALELLYNLQAHLQANQELDEEEKVLIMELAPLYWQQMDAIKQQSRQEGIQQGMQQGMQQAQQVIVENLLKVRFGSVDAELSAIIAPLLQLPPEEFTLLLMQLSREELLTRFRSPD